MSHVKIICEIGINHNGDLKCCKEMIKKAKVCGCDYVKIQKRDPDVCVPEIQKNKMRDTPWGRMRYIDYKKKIEFNEEEIKELVNYSENEVGIELFSSVWDIESAILMSKYTRIGKIGSACITDLELCKKARELFEILIISTGMSNEEEIVKCVNVCNPDVIMHTNSTYPCPTEDLNMRYIEWLDARWPTCVIGYSGHELGLLASYVAVAKGVKWVERHFTLDKNMWGSDQSCSLEPDEMKEMVNGIRKIEKMIQYKPGERILFDNEKIKRTSLRKI